VSYVPYVSLTSTLGVLKNFLLSMHFFPKQMAKANKNPNTIAPPPAAKAMVRADKLVPAIEVSLVVLFCVADVVSAIVSAVVVSVNVSVVILVVVVVSVVVLDVVAAAVVCAIDAAFVVISTEGWAVVSSATPAVPLPLPLPGRLPGPQCEFPTLK